MSFPEPDLDDFDYELPPERIAQSPAPNREDARLLVLERASGRRRHEHVHDLPQLLRAGDLLVVNSTRVLPAKLRGRKRSGGAAEALLLGEVGEAHVYRALVKCRGRLQPGLELEFGPAERRLRARVESVAEDGEARLRFDADALPYDVGEMPLPPYIRREAPDPSDAERYQTIFARVPGSVAAPTAGLHLGPTVLSKLEAAGVERAEVVLHVGPGTFRPVRAADLRADRLPAERFEVPEETAAAVRRARERGGRVVAVGTTTTRALESCASAEGDVEARRGETKLLLRPGSRFTCVDALLTNFHLPRSSLLLLVAAFAGREVVLDAYAEALDRGYRFYSYGDAMLIF